MKLGTVTKREIDKKLVLKRRMLTTYCVLTLDSERCVGCGICRDVCPQEAAKVRSAVIRDGRLIERPFVSIDPLKCTLCGECVVLCPMNAMQMEVDGKERIPVVEAEVFPTLIKEITISREKCDEACDLECQKACPTNAIDVIVEETEEGGARRILDVKVDPISCVFCGRCEYSCPFGAVRVTKPLEGVIRLNGDLCQEKCEACVDICPSQAITLNTNGKPSITEEFCIYCGACQEVCPKKAILVRRTRVLHTEVTSGAWNTALEKLTSYTGLVTDLNTRTRRKIREAVQKIDRF